MTHFPIVPLVVVVLALPLSGCGSTAERHTAGKPVLEPAGDRSPPDQAPAAGEGKEAATAADEKQAFHDALAARLEKAEAEIAVLRNKAAALPERLKTEWDETVAGLERQARSARESLADIERAALDAFGRLRDEASAAWERLEEGVKMALAESERSEPSQGPEATPAEPAGGSE